MRRSVFISNLDKDAFEKDLEVSRMEYLPVVTCKIDTFSVTDSIESFVDLLGTIEKGEAMRDVVIGDENASIGFVRNDGDSMVEVTMKKQGQTIVQKYDIDELDIALRFITDNNA